MKYMHEKSVDYFSSVYGNILKKLLSDETLLKKIIWEINFFFDFINYQLFEF